MSEAAELVQRALAAMNAGNIEALVAVCGKGRGSGLEIDRHPD